VNYSSSSLGSSSGNQPYSAKSTVYPSTPLGPSTWTPSSRRASACLRAPPSPLCPFSNNPVAVAVVGTHRGLIRPDALKTLCHGTVIELNRKCSASGRYFKAIPTCLPESGQDIQRRRNRSYLGFLARRVSNQIIYGGLSHTKAYEHRNMPICGDFSLWNCLDCLISGGIKLILLHGGNHARGRANWPESPSSCNKNNSESRIRSQQQRQRLGDVVSFDR
jgi:hypothetical protein